MSCRSFGQEKSSFTPYQEPMDQKQISLFSRMNLNEKDQISLEGPLRNEIQYEASDLFSMRSRKRKGSVEIQLKQSLPGNRTYLNMSLIGKSSLRNQQLFGMDHEQDLGIQFHQDDDKKELSQKSCPVGASSYHFEQNSANLRIKQDPKPKFLKTKNLLRTVSSYFHKHLLYNIRSYHVQKKYFVKFVQKKKKAIYFGLDLNIKKQEQQLIQKLNQMQINKSQTIQFKSKSQIKIQYQSDDQNYYNSVIDNQQEKSLEVSSCTNLMKKNKGQKKAKQKKKSKLQKNLVQCFKKLTVKLEQKACQQSSHMHHEEQQQDKNKSKIQKEFSQTDFKQQTYVFDQDIEEQIQKFHYWVSNHSIINFVDYQNIWTSHHQYLSIYRQLCYKYYKEQLYCDIMRSRLSIKDVSNKCMWQFVQGLFHPKSFYRFK